MVINSIDLMNGKAVQLQQGKKKILEDNNPLALAEKFNRVGEIAVIDLDAALDKGDNLGIIKTICQKGECRVGGGIRDTQKAGQMIAAGAQKIIVGTQAFAKGGVNQRFLKQLADRIGKERIVVAIDARHGEIVTKGWTQPTGLNVFQVVNDLQPFCGELLYTCVEKEGMMAGTDLEMISKLKESTSLNITTAGGIASTEEITQLAKMEVNMQIGMAIYSGAMSVEDAFIASLNWRNSLLPVITVDSSSQVLMQAYMNKEALRKTLVRGEGWYYSRSRQRLWKKGETSGNEQSLKQIRCDCDGDSLLMTVDQKGVACHKGGYSCFGSRRFSLFELYDVVRDRMENPNPQSYTASLTHTRLREKVMEEAQELIEAQGKDDIIWEAADLLYFVTVLLAKEKVTLPEVLKELQKRRRRSR